MDRTNKEEREGSGKVGFISRIASAITDSFKKRTSLEMTAYDIATFAIAFIVARCHVIFGAHPLAIAMIAVLPERVWIAVVGGAIGSLTLGKSGVVYALISVIVAFLRLIISGTDKSDGEVRVFRERLLLKMSSAVIGGFISAVYELLLSGFTTTSLLYGVSMVLLPPAVVFLTSGLFDSGVTLGALLHGVGEVFSLKRREADERYSILFFECSLLFTIFLLSLSLEEYELLGISAGYIFSALVTIFAARRFGAIRGAAVGFASSVGLSASYSVAFLLAGLGAGAISSLGIVFSVIVGGIALSVWGVYSGGVVGLLSLFPEYAIAGAIAIPLFKRTKLERTKDELQSAETEAEDMVGTMALSYKSRYSGALDTLEGTFASLAQLMRGVRRDEDTVTEREASHLVNECICRYFDIENPTIAGGKEARSLFLERAPRVSTILYKSKSITAESFDTPPYLSDISEALADSVNRAVAILREEKYKSKLRDGCAEEFEYISKLINEARLSDESEKSINKPLTDKVSEILTELGIVGARVQVFGERRPHFIIATEDESGKLISDPELRLRIESAAGIKLKAPEYYRRDKMALMECGTDMKISAEVGSATGDGVGTDVSGDASTSLTTREGCHFSIIADGEGRGEDARRTSSFVTEFLTRSLEFGRGCESALRLLNSTIKGRASFTSSTVDVFSLDLVTGEALFYKCGSAPSYIKRGSSLFRIRSRTSPIGPRTDLDAERIRVECLPGDYVIMFSDGVSADGDDAPWLIELLAKPLAKSTTPDSLAGEILALAKRNSRYNDDMTVRVVKIV